MKLIYVKTKALKAFAKNCKASKITNIKRQIKRGSVIVMNSK